MKLKEVAQQKADNYVKYALGDEPNPDEAFSAKEDFAAGYISGYETSHRVMDFCKQQLKFVLQHSTEKGEAQTAALIKFVLERM